MKKDNTKQIVYKCDCNHYHSEEESEIITIKIRKGIDCDIASALASQVGSTTNIESKPVINNEEKKIGEITVRHSTPTTTTTVAAPAVKLKPGDPGYVYDPADPTVVKLVRGADKEAFLKESAVPMEFLRRLNPLVRDGVGIPSGDPLFESRGAKEIRRV